MATKILNKQQGIVLSSAISDIVIETTDNFVDAVLTNAAGAEIFSERYYPFGGRITFYDISSLIEAEMRATGRSFDYFTLSVVSDQGAGLMSNDSVQLTVLYCDRFSINGAADAFLRDNFLTTLPMRRVDPQSFIRLFLLAGAGESIATRVCYKCREIATGNIISGDWDIALSRQEAADTGIEEVSFPLTALERYAADAEELEVREIELLTLTVCTGRRSATFYIDKTLEGGEAFVFRNCFNAIETVTLPAVSTTKTEVKHSVATLGYHSQLYDKTVTQTCEVETGPLTSDEAEWIDQLLSSDTVLKQNGSLDGADLTFHQVLITDSTCEVSDSDEKPNTIKFTWCYADNRPAVRLTGAPGIFTEEFNHVFS